MYSFCITGPISLAIKAEPIFDDFIKISDRLACVFKGRKSLTLYLPINKGLFTSKDLKNELEELIKFKTEIVANKLNLISRNEFEVQKKIIAKLQQDIVKLKNKKKRKKL